MSRNSTSRGQEGGELIPGWDWAEEALTGVLTVLGSTGSEVGGELARGTIPGILG